MYSIIATFQIAAGECIWLLLTELMIQIQVSVHCMIYCFSLWLSVLFSRNGIKLYSDIHCSAHYMLVIHVCFKIKKDYST
jgi:hypothetical protein